ncbi:MAG: peptidase Ste24p [Frankiales bacterium]|nr:peptidase Ste24p [Frankiales bacterium]
MLGAAALIAAALVLLARVPDRLAAAGWPTRCPLEALVLWQSLGLAAGLLSLELALTVALAPYGATQVGAARALLDGGERPTWWSLVAGAVGLLLLGRLLQVLLDSVVRTLRARRRHRQLVDLLATRNPLVRGASVLEHDLPVAYCLPGLRPRVVVSQGALLTLSGPELEAVLAHEQAHVDQRHDLVVLPFAALRATLPASRAVCTASQEVALLVEMLADDRAARSHDRTVLARALYKVGSGRPPQGSLAAADRGVLLRAERLLDPPPPLPASARALVLAAAAGTAALPLLGLVVPLL